MTVILALHIFLMSSSLLATALMALATAASRTVDARLLQTNVFATAAGVFCGVILIAQNPLDIKCGVLFAYTVAFGAVYAYVKRQNQLLTRSES